MGIEPTSEGWEALGIENRSPDVCANELLEGSRPKIAQLSNDWPNGVVCNAV